MKKWSGAEITDSDREDIIKERMKLRRNNVNMAKGRSLLLPWPVFVVIFQTFLFSILQH